MNLVSDVAMGTPPDIKFPGLGITIDHLGTGILLPIGGGFEIKYYGIIIGFGVLMGYLVACFLGRRERISTEQIADFLIYALIFSVIGARLYYVIFAWDEFQGDLMHIINIRTGGLAIYGGVIGGFTTAFVYSMLKKIPFARLVDICTPGLAMGQAIGRWGNFCNREAFGRYCDNIFAMCIRKDTVYSGYITDDIAAHITMINGAEYIQVHPTFLYESMWNICVVILLVLLHKRKKFDGQIALAYLGFYGLGRIWIEGLRTDQLTIGAGGPAVSQLLSGALILFSLLSTMIILRRQKAGK